MASLVSNPAPQTAQPPLQATLGQDESSVPRGRLRRHPVTPSASVEIELGRQRELVASGIEADASAAPAADVLKPESIDRHGFNRKTNALVFPTSAGRCTGTNTPFSKVASMVKARVHAATTAAPVA